MAGRLRNPLKRWETQVFFFLLFVLLYTLPLLTDWGVGNPVFLYVYFFVVLALNTACLAIFAYVYYRADSENDRNTRTG